MKMMASSLVLAVIIFILNVSETMAACNWPGECVIQCINMVATSVNTDIEVAWAQRETCHDKLTLRFRSLTHPNKTIGSFWITADIRVAALEVNLENVERVSADAFNTNAFRTLKKLTFSNFALPSFENGTFNGLDELEVININSAGGVSRIESGVLDSLTELQEFTFEQSSKSNPELRINGLTGSAELPKLEYVKIRYNLANSIERSTFAGLRNIKRLDLSSCQISSIEDNSFDPISEKIEELDLSGNALITVAYGVFSMTLPNIKTINIFGNQWDCVCELMAFRLFIEQYQLNFIGYDCASPTHCKTLNIVESDCFDTCGIPSTTPTTTTATTTTTTTTSPTTNLIKECHNDLVLSETVSIKRPIGYMTISENEYGDANLNIDTEEAANSLVVIRLDENQNSGVTDDGNGINCLSRSDVSSIPITDLKSDAVYSYCLMQKTRTSVSPLDCISYIKRHDQISPVWLPAGSKILTATLVAIILLLNIVVGMTIAFCWMRHNPFSKQTELLKESRDASSDGDGRRNTNTIQADTFGQNNTLNCPPLPERPSNIYSEEPVYELVYDK